MRLIDITPQISENIAVFPGDQKFERDLAMDFRQGHNLQLSSIKTTVHLGAHADSTGHYHPDGAGIESRPLETFLGDCQVIAVPLRKGERIGLKDLVGISIRASRILFKTASFPNPDQWNGDFMSLSPEVIRELDAQGVILVGIDTPSVDPAESKALESHQALFQTGMAVLEGLVLQKAQPGLYTLMALPLPIKGGDASPVRAVLLDRTGVFADLTGDLTNDLTDDLTLDLAVDSN
jgi:arylformamidase